MSNRTDLPEQFSSTNKEQLNSTEVKSEAGNGQKNPKLAWENDKPTVVALREIAAGLVDYDVIAEADIVEEEPLFAGFEVDEQTVDINAKLP